MAPSFWVLLQVVVINESMSGKLGNRETFSVQDWEGCLDRGSLGSMVTFVR